MSALIARRYSNAFFALACEEGKADALFSDANAVRGVFSEPDVFATLTNPNILQSEKRRIAQESLGGRVDPFTLGLVDLVLGKSRERLILDILDGFIELVRQKRGLTTAKVYTAFALSDTYKQKLAATLGAHLGKTVELEEYIDPKLLGGLRVIVDGTMFDSTVSGKLEDLSRKLQESM
jgi:F-type H+-transporting ATPase subunit delta